MTKKLLITLSLLKDKALSFNTLAVQALIMSYSMSYGMTVEEWTKKWNVRYYDKTYYDASLSTPAYRHDFRIYKGSSSNYLSVNYRFTEPYKVQHLQARPMFASSLSATGFLVLSLPDWNFVCSMTSDGICGDNLLDKQPYVAISNAWMNISTTSVPVMAPVAVPQFSTFTWIHESRFNQSGNDLIADFGARSNAYDLPQSTPTVYFGTSSVSAVVDWVSSRSYWSGRISSFKNLLGTTAYLDLRDNVSWIEEIRLP